MDEQRYGVRPARPEDGDAAFDLFESIGTYPKEDAGVHRASICLVAAGAVLGIEGGPAPLLLVAEERASGAVVGAVMMMPALVDWSVPIIDRIPERAGEVWKRRVHEVSDVAVHPDHRRRGIGTDLMETAVRHIADVGGWLALWFFPESHADAAGFHRSLTPFLAVGEHDLMFKIPTEVFSTIGRATGRQEVGAAWMPLSPRLRVLRDPEGGPCVIDGLWPDSVPWIEHPDGRFTERKLTKEDRRRAKARHGKEARTTR